MESSAAKRQKMSKPAQTSSNKNDSVISMSSYYINHYNRTAYIDKTLLIERLFQIPEHALITAPRRIGKSLNMDMARRFFEIEVDSNGNPIVLQRDEATGYLLDNQLSSENFKLFEGKKIFKNKEFVSKHFGRYPTIFVNFKSVSWSTFQNNLDGMKRFIRDSFREHAYLIRSPIWREEIFQKKTFMQYFDYGQYKSLNESQLLNGLNFLSECLHAHFRERVYVFIDEFDVPASNMIYKNAIKDVDRQNTITFIQEIISNLVKNNDFVQRSLFTGCYNVGSILTQRANNIVHYPFMSNDNICEFYGFTEAEVEYLLKLDQYKTKMPEKLYPQIHEWYKGYEKTLNDGRKISIYITYGIVMCLPAPNTFYNYWTDYTPCIVINAMTHHCFRQKIVDYVTSSEPFKINYIEKWDLLDITTLSNILTNSSITAEHVDLYMQFLYENAFLNPVKFDKGTEEITLEIQNKIVRSVIKNHLYEDDLIKEYYNHDPQKIDHLKKSMDKLAKTRTRSDVIILAKSIEELLLSGTSPCNAFDIHSALYVYLKDKFEYILAECMTSLGTRCDIYIVENVDDDNYVVIIIEIKLGESNDSEKAYKQIFDKKYDSLSKVEKAREVFKDNKIDIKNKIYLGINVSDDCNVTITFSFDDEVLKDSNKNVSSNSP